MKNKLALLFILCCHSFTLLSAQEINKKGILFETALTWQEIQRKAKAEHKYIFLDCFATWCGPCKAMDKNVYTDELVGNKTNSNFISVKVQMDSTLGDNEQVRKWHADIDKISKNYKISAYPTFLFFSPNGELLHKEIGYFSPSAFIQILNDAIDSSKQNVLLAEKYKKGMVNHSKMGMLAITTNKNGNKQLAAQIAKNYKENYLDQINNELILTEENLYFFQRFSTQIASTDRIIKFCLNHPEKLDSIINFKGWANLMISFVITKEEITSKLWNAGKPTTQNPDWLNIREAITQKYPMLDVDQLILNGQIDYYRAINDWFTYGNYRTEKLKKIPPKVEGLNVFMEYNMPAWDAFLNCRDSNVLKEAVNWIDQAIALENPSPQYLDTKANLLYKLGRASDALELEEKAVVMDPKEKDLLDALEKMKEGIPTWPQYE
ncbi:thioredoxin fold domain-containing protein [[Flexibacter] sp. ATCC 35208]|uniref:thioredoxin fold domain-containing protein n=1 Tax=[Flexibacter] sp. ATCC 35208 TaxID=1936242 RepID=UPI0009C7EA7B|nr:thioredoxin fold domain-containing protein [[Flexibacter] sp. ATCC 35208]OMP80066.1 hypothetical protein BW716_06115 [[Flexibacter] sp. ATCC 35208]